MSRQIYEYLIEWSRFFRSVGSTSCKSGEALPEWRIECESITPRLANRTRVECELSAPQAKCSLSCELSAPQVKRFLSCESSIKHSLSPILRESSTSRLANQASNAPRVGHLGKHDYIQRLLQHIKSGCKVLGIQKSIARYGNQGDYAN